MLNSTWCRLENILLLKCKKIAKSNRNLLPFIIPVLGTSLKWRSSKTPLENLVLNATWVLWSFGFKSLMAPLNIRCRSSIRWGSSRLGLNSECISSNFSIFVCVIRVIYKLKNNTRKYASYRLEVLKLFEV